MPNWSIPSVWDIGNAKDPFLRRTRLQAEPKNLHKSKGVLDTGNAKALSKDDIHERGDSANGDAKKSRGSCCRGKVSDDEAWVGNKLASRIHFAKTQFG